MPKDITKFVGKGISRETATREEFFRLVDKAIDKWELRKLEEALLKPTPIPPYKGTETGRTEFKKRTLMLAFPSSKYIDRWSKLIRINQYKDNNSWDVEVFELFLLALETGRVVYDRKGKRLRFKTRKGTKVTI